MVQWYQLEKQKQKNQLQNATKKDGKKMDKFINETIKGIDLRNDSKVKWTDYEDTTEEDIDLLLEEIYTNPYGEMDEEL